MMLSMGFEIVGVILVAIYLGSWLDEKYSWGGLGLVGSFVVGFVGWLTHVLVIIRNLEQSENSGDTERK
jgi:hypothetical protein